MSKYIDKDKVLEYIIFGVVGKDITFGELTRAIESLPTIEVSEDCISREWVLREFEKGKEMMLSKSESFDELIWLVIHAPSVIPSRAEGEWVDEKGVPIPDQHAVYCSLCHSWSEYRDNFCGNCGARMCLE